MSIGGGTMRSQIGRAWVQRGRNRQPGGIRPALGTIPGIGCRSAPVLPSRGMLPSRPGRIGMPGRPGTARPDRRFLGDRPGVHHHHASAVPAMTPRSCVIKIIAMPNSLAQLREQVENLRLDGDVERRRRLVGDQSSDGRRSPSRS